MTHEPITSESGLIDSCVVYRCTRVPQKVSTLFELITKNIKCLKKKIYKKKNFKRTFLNILHMFDLANIRQIA